MVEAERETTEVLQQLSVLSSATREATLAFARVRLRERLASELESEALLNELLADINLVLARSSRLS